MQQVWVDLAQQMNLEGVATNRYILLKQYNKHMNAMWVKYLKTALEQMAAKLKRKGPAKELRRTEDQIALPYSSLNNYSDFKMFESFVQSDMLVETIRALKMRSVVNLATN